MLHTWNTHKYRWSKSKWIEKNIHANTSQKKAWVTTLTLDKFDFIEIKKDNFIMKLGSVHPEDIKILNDYVLNRYLEHVKQNW